MILVLIAQLVWSQCDIDNCITCSVGFVKTCLECEDQYGSVASICSQCLINNCKNCDADVNDCQECLNGYDKTSTGVCCLEPNCKICSDPDVCDDCEDSYFLDGSNNCCQIDKCNDCQNDPSVCTQCNDGYSKSSTGVCCLEPNCKTCSNPDVCDDCEDSYFLNDAKNCCSTRHCSNCSNEERQCTGCGEGRLTSISQCCEVNRCKDCSSDFEGCDQCIDGYTYFSGGCRTCNKSNCKICEQRDVCDECLDNFFFDNISPQSNRNCCVSNNCADCSTNDAICTCIDEYGLNSSNMCVSCSDTNCLYCQADNTSCTQCKNDFYPDTNGKCCVSENCDDCTANINKCTCKDYFGLNQDDKCTSCQDTNCKICRDNYQNCDTCRDGFHPDRQGACVATQHCLKSSEGKCTQCESGYFLQDILCNQCSSECNTCSPTDPAQCYTCSTLNAVPNVNEAGCVCNENSYQVQQSSGVLSCNSCHQDCLRCQDRFTCSQCKISDAIISDVGCTCPPGFYDYRNSQSELSCIECEGNCFTCTNATYCLSCTDPNARAENGECKCKTGYVDRGINGIIDCQLCTDCQETVQEPQINCEFGYYELNGKCAQCLQLCSSCDDLTALCRSCKSNASSQGQYICTCNSGYEKQGGECVEAETPTTQSAIDITCEIQDSQAALIFSRQLTFDLQREHIQVLFNQLEIDSWEMQPQTLLRYLISIQSRQLQQVQPGNYNIKFRIPDTLPYSVNVNRVVFQISADFSTVQKYVDQTGTLIEATDSEKDNNNDDGQEDLRALIITICLGIFFIALGGILGVAYWYRRRSKVNEYESSIVKEVEIESLGTKQVYSQVTQR